MCHREMYQQEKFTLKRLKYLVLNLALSASAFTMAASTTGNITLLQATIDDPIHSPDQQGIILIQLSTALHVNCAYLGLPKGNPYFASTILSAEARGKQVRIWYDENTPVSTICKAYTVQVLQ